MRHDERIRGILGGPVEAVVIHGGTRQVVSVAEHNLTMYAGGDILGRLLAGQSEYAIGAMYFEFTNGVPATPSFDETEGVEYYAGLVDPQDYVRVPLAISPSLAGSDGNYSSNKVTFFAMTTAVVGENGVGFTSGDGSQVIGGALVATPTADKADDIVYARFYFGSPVAVGATGDFGIQWTTQVVV